MMQYDILVTKQPNNGYLARPVLLPELVVTGTDATDALRRVRDAIVDLYAQSQIVRIDVPVPVTNEDDPWLQFAGQWGNEQDWQQFEQDVETFRVEIDQQTEAVHE